MRKLNEAEKTLLKIAGDKYDVYVCKEHGLFLSSKDNSDNKCYGNKCSVVLVDLKEVV